MFSTTTPTIFSTHTTSRPPRRPPTRFTSTTTTEQSTVTSINYTYTDTTGDIDSNSSSTSPNMTSTTPTLTTGTLETIHYILAGVLPSIFVLIVIMVIVIVCCRKRRPTTLIEDGGISMEPVTRIPIDDLQEFIRNPERIITTHSQYETISAEAPSLIFAKTRDKAKDMYVNIVPYEHNCVKLEPIPGKAKSTYINASYIDSYRKPKAYIAATGPRDTSLIDFWRMIWEQAIDFVFMLTLLTEKSQKKCVQYWPDVVDDNTQYGEVLVTFKKEKHYMDHIVRYFSVKNNDVERTVTQYQIITWNDKTVPENPYGVLKLRAQLQRQCELVNSPILLHCSAGVGRTGTLLAIDYLMDQARAEGAIDVFECVKKLRSQRVKMVQTVDQYNFVFEAVADGILLENQCIAFSQFLAAYRVLKEPQPDGLTRVQHQYDLLTKMNFKEKSIRLERGKSTISRLPGILKNRISSYLNTRDSASSFQQIDAVLVKSYNMQPTYLSTSAPSSDKTLSFWQMIWNNGCRSIVMLCPFSDMEVADQYCPEEETDKLEKPPFMVECTSKKISGHHVTRKLLLTNNGSREITHHTVDCSMSSLKNQEIVDIFTSIYEEVIVKQKEFSKTPVVVHCLDGIEWTGLYCAFSCLLDQITSDKEIDVFQVTRLIRNANSRWINVGQYAQLYDLLYIYVGDNI